MRRIAFDALRGLRQWCAQKTRTRQMRTAEPLETLRNLPVRRRDCPRYSTFARIASVSLALDSPNSSADIAMVCLIGFHSAFFTSATKAMGM